MFDARQYDEQLNEAAEFLKKELGRIPDISITAGSGLSDVVNVLDKAGRKEIPFSAIPNHPKATVAGHKGCLISGTASGKNVIILSGRVHKYEGHESENLVFLTRALLKLGVETFFLTNAAGGVNPNFSVGSFMILSDHINLTFFNPLIGKHLDKWGDRFVDLCKPYDEEITKKALELGLKNKIEVNQGVYIALMGPTYETKAEVAYLRMYGDAVGMSTVPEVLAIRQAAKKVFAVSIITNSHVRQQSAAVTHTEVLDISSRVGKQLSAWFKDLIKVI